MKKLHGLIVATTLAISSLIGVGTFLAQQKGNEVKEVVAANTTLYSHTLVKADFDFQYAWTSTDGNFYGNHVTAGDSYAEMTLGEYWNYFKFKCTNEYFLDTISMPFSFGGDAKAILWDLNGSSSSVKVTEKTFTSSSANLTFTGLAYKGGTEFEIDIYRNPKSATPVYGRYIYGQDFVLTGYNTITVSLDKNGGTGGASSVSCTPGSAMPTITSLPTRTGYTFAGYWTEATGGTKYYNANGTSAATYPGDSVTKLYAHWTANNYNVVYLANKPSNATGNVTNLPAGATWTYDSNATLGGAPSLTGWTFGGWYKEAACTNKIGNAGANVTKPNLATSGTANIYAKWTANTYTVKYNGNKPSDATGSVTNLPADATWTYDNNATLGSTPSLPGWTFGGWYKEAACTNKLGNAGATLTKPNLRTTAGTYNVYAKWTPNTYTARYAGNKPAKAPQSYNVTGVPSDATWTYDSPSKVTLGSAPSLTGYVFGGWYKEAACTNKIGNAGEQVLKPNLTIANGGVAYLYAKWSFNEAVQTVVDKINNTKTCGYDNLTAQIEDADSAYNDLVPEFQAVVDSEGYTHILDNAKAADAVGQMIEDLGVAQDTDAWRNKVEAARDAYDDLEDKTYIPLEPIMKILEDDEAAVTVMNTINDIGNSRWTDASETLIETAEDAYSAYILADHPAEQIANYDELLYARATYDNVSTFVDKVNDITNNPFEYTQACKALIEEARRYYEEDMDTYQQGLAREDAKTYYDLLVNYENAWNAMYLIEAIGDMENTEACGEKIEAARDAVDALNQTTELPLMRADLLKDLTDKEAAWGVMELINAIYPMSYGEETENAIETARSAYNALEDDQEQYVANYDDLVKAEEDYAAVEAVVAEVAAIGDIRHDEESKAKIEHARDSYEALTEDQKGFYPDFSLQSIVDYETAYVALDKIYNIGGVNYDSISETKIGEARDFYDNVLTDAQRDLINAEDLHVLEVSEDAYWTLKKNADTLVIILLILVCLVIVGAGLFLFFLLAKKRKKDDDEDNQKGKKEPVKAMSVGGLLPLLALVSHYTDSPYIAVYVLAGIGVLCWLAILCLVIMKKKEVGPFKKKEVQPVASSQSEDEEESVTITDEKGNVFQIRFIKSYTAKLIQAPEETKKYYEELKNEVLSYKNTNSRVSWHYESVNSGRNQVLKFAVRGKRLCVYFPLNADEYAESKYKVEKVESKKFEDVPCLYRIKNDRRLGYAKDLIAKVAKNLGLEKGKEKHESYANLPYETNKPLIERGLIKEQKIQVNKPAEEVLETKVNAEGDEIVTTKDSSGNIFEIRYIKSFTAKLSQASDEVKNYYNILKNHALSYKKANSRVSWHFDSINVGREQVLKIAIRGKTLCVYYALEAEKVDEKYKVEKVESKKFADVPCLYRIKNDRRCGYAKELIDMLMRKLHVEMGKETSEDFSVPYEETKALLKKGLIKEVKAKVASKEEVHEAVSVNEADQRMSDEDAEAKISEDLNSKKHEGKKGIINIDTIGENFNDGDVVTLEALWEKKLVPSSVGYVKVLARGTLNKKLTLDLQDYSIQAVKMVLLEGGAVKKAK